jgi:hypothetical protein
MAIFAAGHLYSSLSLSYEVALVEQAVAQVVRGDWPGTEARCLAHVRRKVYELWTNHSSQIAEEALSHFGKLYDVEREAREMSADERRQVRQARARPVAEALHTWLLKLPLWHFDAVYWWGRPSHWIRSIVHEQRCADRG